MKSASRILKLRRETLRMPLPQLEDEQLARVMGGTATSQQCAGEPDPSSSGSPTRTDP